eukprot:1142755-Pelagomonas_calceolata.AAC.3
MTVRFSSGTAQCVEVQTASSSAGCSDPCACCHFLYFCVAHAAASHVEGSYADQRRKVAGLNQRLQECVLPGDVLRAVGGQHQPLKHWCCVLSAFRMRCPPVLPSISGVCTHISHPFQVLACSTCPTCRPLKLLLHAQAPKLPVHLPLKGLWHCSPSLKLTVRLPMHGMLATDMLATGMLAVGKARAGMWCGATAGGLGLAGHIDDVCWLWKETRMERNEIDTLPPSARLCAAATF